MVERKFIDWEAIEREYRAGTISLRAIATAYDITEGAIRKRAIRDEWVRALADKVRANVREKLTRLDGAQDGTQPQHTRTKDADIVEAASLRGLEVVTSHRRDLQQLHGLKRILLTRLAAHLNGEEPEGPFMGERESPGDLVEKLSRVTTRLIPLERQAHNLDESGSSLAEAATTISDESRARALAAFMARTKVSVG
jgi:hypothetical protein